MHALCTSGFPVNAAKLRTHLPKPVGHGLADVTQQLAGQIDGAGGRKLNDPRGFVDNFKKKFAADRPEDDHGAVPYDVLGYYETNPDQIDPNTAKPVDDLPMYSFLAKNFAYSDRYFCAHPGPTIPNRMFSLTGDVQHDRLGAPILDNNGDDNFLLSRATTIYDVLARHGVSFRVYESNPSVTMLRMFTRYATDDVHIRQLDRLEHDVETGDLPSVVVVEPAMHHYPQNDDHPDADMYRGQSFIRRVYNALSKNRATWERTLLLVTYDEHGGFYDHVVPPIADVIEPMQVVFPGVVPHPERVASTPSTHATSSVEPRTPEPSHVGLNLGHVELGGLLPLEVAPSSTTIQIHYGVRVPMFVVSPNVPADARPDITLDHCSILKTILARFCGDTRPFLGDRVHASRSFEAFLTAPVPRRDIGAVPGFSDLPADGSRRTIAGASAIITPPLFRKRMREEQVDFHELSGRLARMLGR
jgi:hypothetical protein